MRSLGLCCCLWLAWIGCEGPPDGEASRQATDELRPVTLPNLAEFPESVREQLKSQHAQILEVADRQQLDSAKLGEAYGVLGQLLHAYDLNYAAEPALLNAAALLPGNLRWHYYLGHLYKAEGRLELAAHHFELAYAADPDYLPARIYLAEVYGQIGRRADAESHLHDMLRRDPDNAVAHLLLGQTAGSDDPSKAIEHYEAVLRLQPGASMVRYPLALAYRDRGDLARSREHLAQRGQVRVVFHDPLIEEMKELTTGPGAKVFRGNMLLEQRRFEEAAELFTQAAEEDPANVSAHLNLGVAVSQLGDLERATRAVQRALELDPANARAHYNLGILALYSDEPAAEDSAITHFQTAVDADPGMSAARFRLANVLWHKRRCRDAIPQFESYLEARPDHIEARIRQAICHVQRREYPAARDLLEKGHDAFPEDGSLQEALVRLLAASPDPTVRDGERALAMAERLFASERRLGVVESLAMAYAELGRYPEAVRAQREVVSAAERERLPPEALEFLRENLQLYEQRQPCRAPWPPTVFDR